MSAPPSWGFSAGMETEKKSCQGKCGAPVKARATKGRGGHGVKEPQLCDVTVTKSVQESRGRHHQGLGRLASHWPVVSDDASHVHVCYRC